MTIKNAQTGPAVDIDAGDTGWTVAMVEQGVTSTSVDPNIPFYTSHKVDIDAGDADSVIAGFLNTAIDGVADFGSSAASEVLTVTNAAYGECTQVTDVDTGFVSRNVNNQRRLEPILYRFFESDAKFLDIGGGYGLLTRLMLDV